MLSVKSFKAGKSAQSIANYVQQTGAETYYGSGYWGGQGAAAMGLSGSLEAGELERILAGRDPKTGEAITQKVDEAHKAGWDLTYSAPKSVSVIWAADPAARGAITTAHEAAVSAAMVYLEKEAFYTRHGHAGKEHQPITEAGGLVYSVHHHAATRAGDPGLHSHTIVANLTADGRGIDFDTCHKMIAGALYRAELASHMKQLGYTIERDETSFKIAGVSQELVEHWSKRSEEIAEVMNEKGLSGAEAKAQVAADTRLDKSGESEHEAFKRWEAEAKGFGYETKQVKELGAASENKVTEMPAIKSIMDELTMKDSTVSELQLKTAFIQASQGVYSAEKALASHEAGKTDKSIIYLQSEQGLRATTQDVLDRERRMLEAAERMANRNTHQVAPEALLSSAKWETLRPEQKETVAHLTTGGDLVALQGWAGTGKTYALSVAVEAWQQSGYQVIASAPSNKAVEALSKEAGLDNVLNTTKLELQLARGEIALNDKTVLIIDEAGMEGSRRIGLLIDKAEAAGAKIVLQGDTKQLQSIEAGAAMRGVIEKTGAAELGHDSVVRQKAEIYKEIARDVREGRAYEAITKLEKNGDISAHKDAKEAHKGASNAYLQDLAKGKESILVAFTRNEVKQLNAGVREALKEQGAIEKTGHEFKTANGTREFVNGDKVIFGEKQSFENSQVINGSRGVVEAVTDKSIFVRLDDTKELVRVDPETYNKLDHGHATTVHKAQGLSTDTAHVVVGDRSNQEWAYVAVSRHKEELTIHTTKDVVEREKTVGGKEHESVIDKTFSKSSAKDLSTDYERIDPPGPNGHQKTAIDDGKSKSDQGAELPKSERSPNELQKTPLEQRQDNTQSKDNESAKARPEQQRERAQAMPESRANTRESNLKPRQEQTAERAQAMAREQAKSINKDNTKPTPEQRQANIQKLNEAIKQRAQEVVKKVEAVKTLTLDKSAAPAPKSPGAGMGL